MDRRLTTTGSRLRKLIALLALTSLVLISACSSDSGSDDATPDTTAATGAPGAEAAAWDQPTPDPEPVAVTQLPLPPTAPSEDPGSCTNPTGCISATEFGLTEGPSYTWDGNEVLISVTYAGAPAGSAATGSQITAIKTDGTTFPNGDAWRCITCGVPDANKVGSSEALDHPQPFHDGTRILAGTNIVDCAPHPITSDECTPDAVHIYPLYWPVTADGSGKSGSMRELRLHPDDVHIGWSHLVFSPQLAEPAFMGRLEFNDSPTNGEPLVPRYDLINVWAIQSPDPAMSGTFVSVDEEDPTKLSFDEPAGVIGEFRGWTSDGQEALGFGIEDSANFDVYATSLQTGASRRLSRNPAYVDPMKASPDDEWNVILDSRVDDRMMFIAGLPGVPSLTDQVLGVPFVVSGMRNNLNRRFFQPYLLDRYGDRRDYDGQQLNACGPDDNPAEGSGSICDPLWNARADPAWSPDGTTVVYWQALVTEPSCGGANPLACPASTEPGGRRTRLMMAELTSREPVEPYKVDPIADEIPWGIAYNPGDPWPVRAHVPAGTYTLDGKHSGSAQVVVTENPEKNATMSLSVTYTDFSNDGRNFVNGTERAEATADSVTWHEDITLSGEHTGTRKTSEPEGFTTPAGLNALANPIFEATGTMTVVLDGTTYTQPANGT